MTGDSGCPGVGADMQPGTMGSALWANCGDDDGNSEKDRIKHVKRRPRLRAKKVFFDDAGIIRADMQKKEIFTLSY